MIDIVLVRIISFMEITDNKIGFLRYELAKVVVVILVKRRKFGRKKWFSDFLNTFRLDKSLKSLALNLLCI